MNHSNQQVNNMNTMQRMQGMTLLEILLAMVIFVIGMLALAHLQTNLTRSNTDANLRTVATNVGEEVMESLRNFQRLSTDPDPNPIFAFADIDQALVERTVHLGEPLPEGLDYVVTATVEGWDFEPDFEEVNPTDVPAVKGVIYDFKLVE